MDANDVTLAKGITHSGTSKKHSIRRYLADNHAMPLAVAFDAATRLTYSPFGTRRLSESMGSY